MSCYGVSHESAVLLVSSWVVYYMVLNYPGRILLCGQSGGLLAEELACSEEVNIVVHIMLGSH